MNLQCLNSRIPFVGSAWDGWNPVHRGPERVLGAPSKWHWNQRWLSFVGPAGHNTSLSPAKSLLPHRLEKYNHLIGVTISKSLWSKHSLVACMIHVEMVSHSQVSDRLTVFQLNKTEPICLLSVQCSAELKPNTQKQSFCFVPALLLIPVIISPVWIKVLPTVN